MFSCICSSMPARHGTLSGTILVMAPNVILCLIKTPNRILWLLRYSMVALVPCLTFAFPGSLFVPTLCLKDPQMGNNTIHSELLTVGVVRWSKLPGCKKNSPLTISNYLLKHIGVTIIHRIYSLREIVALLSRLHTFS